MSGRVWRIASLLAQPVVIAMIVTRREDSSRIQIAASVLIAVWVIAIGALGIRVVDARRKKAPMLAQLDPLTAAGATSLVIADIALYASTIETWASLSVVGVLGLGIVLGSVIWLELVAAGDEAWRRATITRAILPESAVEGDKLREEIRMCDLKIPTGTRLFVQGRGEPRTPITRYAVGSENSLAEFTLASDLGPAHRGEHRAPPLAMWLADVLGLARTPVVFHAECSWTVLPKAVKIDNAQDLLGKGGDDQMPTPVVILPTEGTFRTREYAPGDDTRRIHWVRSINANKLVVRLPDEIPTSEPTVRLVLDTEQGHVDALASTAPDEVLDAMVRVWLAIGKSLVESGRKVVLVTTATNGKLVSRPLIARSREPLKLGARAAWQAGLPLVQMLDEKSTQIVVTCRPRKLAGREDDIRWVVVPERTWAAPAPSLPLPPSAAVHAFPLGAAENRPSRRKRDRARIEEMQRDRAYFSQIAAPIDWSVASGSYIAHPTEPGKPNVRLAVVK